MVGKLFYLGGRHQDKEKVKVEFGSDEDKNLDLSGRGKNAAFVEGRNLIKPRHYDLVVKIESDFLRAQRTNELRLRGAGYDPEKATTLTRPDTGSYGINWKVEGIPSVSDMGKYIKVMMGDFYFSNKDNAPSLAKWAFANLDALLTGIGLALPIAKDGGRSLIVHAAHSPGFDAYDALVFNSVEFIEKGAQYKEGKFPGFYGMGEFMQAKVVTDLTSSNPVFQIDAKNRTIPLSLIDLKEKRDIVYNHASRP